MHQGWHRTTPFALPSRCLAPKPLTHIPPRCMHSFGNVTPAAAAGRQAVQLSSTAMRAGTRGMHLVLCAASLHTTYYTDIQPQSDDDDDVEENAMLLPRQGPLQTSEAPALTKSWWRVPVSWEVMVCAAGMRLEHTMLLCLWLKALLWCLHTKHTAGYHRLGSAPPLYSFATPTAPMFPPPSLKCPSATTGTRHVLLWLQWCLI